MSRVPGSAKTGGRQRGALNRQRRQEISEEIAFDVLSVYRGLGGTIWLMQLAKDQPALFLQQCLSRLLPAAQRPDDDGITVNQLNVGNLSDIEAACRIAFALEKGLRAKREQKELEQPVAVQEPADD